MRRILPCAAIVIGWMLVAPAAAQEAPDCRLRVVAALDMRTTDDGRVTIPVQIDGHDYKLMVDTGGYFNTVSSRVVKREGYQPRVSQGVVLRGLGTTFMDSYIRIKDFAIGGMHGRNFDFFVDDDYGLAYDGLLAPQVLAMYDVDFDFAHGKFNLISPDHCPGQVAYWTNMAPVVVPITIQNRTHIRIPVMIDGKKIMATVDTGAHTSMITLRAAARFLDVDQKTPGMKAKGNVAVNGMVAPGYSYPFKTLQFGDITVNNPHIEIVSDRVWGSEDLLLGVGILRQLHMYVAYGEKKMYLTPALEDRGASGTTPAQ